MKTLATIALACFLSTGCAAPGVTSFPTPEEAMQRLVVAAEDERAADELLGPGGFGLLRSGDEAADRNDFEAVVAMVSEGLAFEDLNADTKLALLGRERWEFPIPLVREAGLWRFDVEAGREEVLNRRVGRNELSTLATLRAIVDAQREYAAVARDGNPRAYAQRIVSTENKRDGLYWPAVEGEVASPLGPLVAEAAEDGYSRKGSQPMPYHGYLFRLLKEQGAHAPGGAKRYVDAEGHLTGGFAILAWPATYDNSGVMTFLVNHRGLVFQKDLGKDTAQAVTRIQSYDPDGSWTPTPD